MKWDLFQGFANKGRKVAREAQIRILESQLNNLGEQFRKEAERQAFDWTWTSRSSPSMKSDSR